MYYIRAFKGGALQIEEYADNIEWFKSANSQCDLFKIRKLGIR